MMFDPNGVQGKPCQPFPRSHKPKLLDQVRAAIRVQHYSLRTEQAYLHWIKRFIFFHHKRHPADMGKEELVTDKVSTKRRTRREISDRQRFRILVRDGFRCMSCGASPLNQPGVELHVDHIVPWSKGGETTDDNLQSKCAKCNLGKGNAYNV